MRKFLIATAFLSVLVGCCLMSPRTTASPAPFVGRWSGEAPFLDRDLSAEYRAISVELDVRVDGTLAGSLGAARLVDVELYGWEEQGLEVRARIDGAIFPEGSLPSREKRSVVLLLPSERDGTLSGNLHLKSDFTFDLSMLVCGLELTRAP
jgi:hypothetical protein